MQANQAFRSAAENLFQTASAMKEWEGESQVAFIGAITKDKGQMEAFHELVDKFIAVLGEMVRLYVEAEQKNAELARQRSY